jgi:hypothetical protein
VKFACALILIFLPWKSAQADFSTFSEMKPLSHGSLRRRRNARGRPISRASLNAKELKCPGDFVGRALALGVLPFWAPAASPSRRRASFSVAVSALVRISHVEIMMRRLGAMARLSRSPAR